MKRVAIVIITLLLWYQASNLNRSLDNQPLDRKERMTMIITSERVKPYLLGYHSVVADYIWIKTILYFGAHFGNSDLPWLKSMISSVTALYPEFFPPYEFAGLMVPQIDNDLNFARTNLSHGLGRVKQGEERVAFYLAYIYFKEYHDYSTAADLLSFAASSDKAPPFWKSFAATLYSKSSEADMGVLFLQALYESAEDPQVKEQIKSKISAVESGDVDIHTPKPDESADAIISSLRELKRGGLW